MSFTPTTPVTGAAIASFTSPTYTLTADVAPSSNGKQYAITSVGGTQTGVDTHSVSKPFTLSFFRPMVLRTLPQANPITGIIKGIPLNVYKLITRKGASPAVNQTALVPTIITTISVPAGCDTYEPEDLKAMLSVHFGCGWQACSGIADTIITGVM